jgi:hypothetical protein
MVFDAWRKQLLSANRLVAPFALLFVALAVLLPATGFFDLYLLPWQTRLIFLKNPSFWHAMRDEPLAYLPFTHFSAVPYGPLFYYPLGLWVFALDKAGLIDMHAWTNLGLVSRSFRNTALLKVPNLLVYLGTGVVLMRMLPGRSGVDAMLLWLLNPAVILVSFVMGQNDGWSAFTVVSALLLAKTSLERQAGVRVGRVRVPSSYLAMAVLGLGAGIKIHPLLLVAPFGLLLGATWRERMALMTISVLTFGLVISPFVTDRFFRAHALANPQGQDILRYHIGHLALIYPAYIAAVALPWLRHRRDFVGLVVAVAAVHLLIFVLTDWPPERAAWFIAALAVPAVLLRVGTVAYAVVTVDVLVRALGFGNGLGIGVFAVAAPRLAAGPSLTDALDRAWSYQRIEQIGFWMAAASFAAAVTMLLRQERVAVRRIPTSLPIAMLLLLPLYFVGAAVYQWNGWTSQSAIGERRTIQGPVVIEQPLSAVADSLSGVDVFVSSGGTAGRVTGSLTDGDHTEALETSAPRTGGRYVRMAFRPISNSSSRAYVLELDIPAGMGIRTVQASPVLPTATVGGKPSRESLDVRTHYETDWEKIGGDVVATLRRSWVTVLATSFGLGASLFLVAWNAARFERRGHE